MPGLEDIIDDSEGQQLNEIAANKALNLMEMIEVAQAISLMKRLSYGHRSRYEVAIEALKEHLRELER